MDLISGSSLPDGSRICEWISSRSRDGYVLMEKDGSPIFWNDVLKDWIGELARSDRIDFSDFCTEESAKVLIVSWNRLSESGTSFCIRVKLKRRQEAELWVDCSGEVLPFELNGARLFGLEFRDVTELKLANDRIGELEERLVHAQKQETLGLLASGIAHDLNNNLTPITLYASLAERKLETGDTFTKHFRAIRDAAKECSALTRQLLSFSRRQTYEPAPISSELLIKRMEKMLRRLARDDVALAFNYPEQSYGVMVDENQMHQVVLNLLANAQEAMPRQGRIAIDVGAKCFTKSDSLLPERREPGDYASISFVDTGIGINEEIQARIFEPYFTTKEDQGIGLGLVVCSDIIERQGGFMVFSSGVGEGARFTAYLPRYDAELPRGAKAGERELIRGQGQTVLVVDDSARVRGAACLFLSENGYKLMEAGSAEAALALLAEARDSIDLVLTDVVMPDRNGQELLEEARELKPDLPLVFMSGYGRGRLGPEAEELPFVSKPLNACNLLQIVHEVLNRPEF